MSHILQQPISGPAAWQGHELARERSWCHSLSGPQLKAIDAALEHLRGRGRSFPDFTLADFPLKGMSRDLEQWTEKLEDGHGFLLLRGLPVGRYDDRDIQDIYYGLGLNLGEPVRQNPRGDLLGLVMNVADARDPQARVYETSARLPYHTDPSDVVGLLCLRRARHGGESSLVSAASVYNLLLRDQAQHLETLYRPFHYAHLGGDRPGRTPVFSYHAGKLSCRYLRQYIELGHDMVHEPLSSAQVAALDALDAAIQVPDLQLDMMLEPGDLQFANNYMVLHSRTAFEDSAEPGQERKMLRLWLKMPNARRLAADFPGRNGFGSIAASVA